MSDIVDIYTDGACKGNPGVGGWGVLLKHGGRMRELYGGEVLTTNNRMELTAVIRALEALKRRCKVRVHTDSQYVHLGAEVDIELWPGGHGSHHGLKPQQPGDTELAQGQAVFAGQLFGGTVGLVRVRGIADMAQFAEDFTQWQLAIVPAYLQA